MDKRQYNRSVRREVRRRVKEQIAIRTTEQFDPQVMLDNATAKVGDTTRSAMSGDVSAIKRHWHLSKRNYANIPMTYAKRLPDKQFRSIDSEIRRMKPGEDVSGLVGRLGRLKVALERVNLSESRSTEAQASWKRQPGKIEAYTTRLNLPSFSALDWIHFNVHKDRSGKWSGVGVVKRRGTVKERPVIAFRGLSDVESAKRRGEDWIRSQSRKGKESRSSEFGAKNPMLVAAAKGFLKKAQAAAKAGDKNAAKRFLTQAETKLGQTDAGAVSEAPKIGRILSQAKNSLRGNAPGSMAAEQIGLIIKALQQSRVKVR